MKIGSEIFFFSLSLSHVPFSDWIFRFWTGLDSIIRGVISLSGSVLVPCLVSPRDFKDSVPGHL